MLAFLNMGPQKNNLKNANKIRNQWVKIVLVKSKDWLFIKRNCKLDRNRWVSLILLRFARLQCLAATHLSSPEVGNGLSWPKPPCTCNVMVTSQAQHSTNEGVLRSNSACSMLMSDDLRLPRRGIEPRPSGFRDIGSTSGPSPLPVVGYFDLPLAVFFSIRMKFSFTMFEFALSK